MCFQEVFTQPYFCPSQDSRWYAAAEPMPEGYTVKLMQEYARKHNMVIIVPIYEEAMTGVYYNAAAVLDARNKATGELVGTVELPAPGQYGMMSYMHEGDQYIVVQVGRGGVMQGALAALRLPSDGGH